MQLVCFPFAGGGAATYREWSALLPETVELIAVEPPGRQTRFLDPPFETPDEIARAVCDAFGSRQERPYVVFGYSLGAALGIEFVRETQRRGASPPGRMFCAAFAPPHLPREKDFIHDLPEAEFLQRLARLGGIPPALLENAELMRLMSKTLRADLRMAETYHFPEPLALPCGLTVFGGTEDSEVDATRLHAWAPYSSGEFALYRLEGGHFFIHDQAATVIRLLLADLARTLPISALAA